ncbi:UNVERIFIED_CONTAM: hypothetical protein Scaly_0683400 [Sesamum calycinum]|uniref:Retrovirus-related Pol polyprotein from transposon TNT 1-94-like beta-barrel domain-containing protein n=1 Tax=Sesamum calycinum TaxID=2727403 RepID=A0AAW2R6L8_9LAMI
MIAISIKEEHRNQTHKMSVEHQPKANLIVGKQKVNKVNSNSVAIKARPPKIRNQKQTNHAGTVDRLDTEPSFVLIKRLRLGRQLSMVVGGYSRASTSGATEEYVFVQPEFLTIYEPCDWLIDIGVNVHVCAEKYLFVSYQAITGRTVSMGNSSIVEVLGVGSVDLKFPLGRILSLSRVHHVPTQFGIFVGKGYLDDGLFKVRVENDKNDIFDSIVLNIESSTLWHSSTSLTHEELDIPRWSKRARIVKDFGSDFVTYNIEDDPITFKDATASSEAKQWKEAIKSDMDSIV